MLLEEHERLEAAAKEGEKQEEDARRLSMTMTNTAEEKQAVAAGLATG